MTKGKWKLNSNKHATVIAAQAFLPIQEAMSHILHNPRLRRIKQSKQREEYQRVAGYYDLTVTNPFEE